MSEEQCEHIVKLAQADREFWNQLKLKEIEIEEHITAHPDHDTPTLPQPTFAGLVKEFVGKHLGHVPNLDYGRAIVPLRGAVRAELGL